MARGVKERDSGHLNPYGERYVSRQGREEHSRQKEKLLQRPSCKRDKNMCSSWDSDTGRAVGQTERAASCESVLFFLWSNNFFQEKKMYFKMWKWLLLLLLLLLLASEVVYSHPQP